MSDHSLNNQRARRRARPARRQFDTSVPSPCIQVCRLENEVCVGCGRSIDEVRTWMILTADEKHQVIVQSKARLAAMMPRVEEV